MWFFFFAFSWRNRSWWAMASLLWKLHDYTQSHHTPWYSSGRVISSSQRPLPDNTQHSQHRHIFMPRWESNPQSQQGSGHIPHGRWDQHSTATQLLTWKTQIYIYIYILWCPGLFGLWTSVSLFQIRKRIYLTKLVMLRDVLCSSVIGREYPQWKGTRISTGFRCCRKAPTFRTVTRSKMAAYLI